MASGVFEVLNGCAMDVAWMGIAAQAPAVSQINAESARLRAEFPSIVPQHAVTEGRSAATQMVAFVRDSTDGFLTTPNNPLRDKLPAIAGASPGDGLAMVPGSRNAFSLVMGSAQAGANMTTSQSIRDRFFLNYMEGDLHKAIGSPMDTGQANNNTFAAVARHFPVGDPNDLHVMRPDGMHLRAICSREPYGLPARPCLGGDGAAAIRMAAGDDAEGALSQPQGRPFLGANLDVHRPANLAGTGGKSV